MRNRSSYKLHDVNKFTQEPNQMYIEVQFQKNWAQKPFLAPFLSFLCVSKERENSFVCGP